MRTIAPGLLAGRDSPAAAALDVATGAVRWKFKTGSRVASSPAVAAGRVYFASYDGYIYALDARTGELRWKFHTDGEHRFGGKHLQWGNAGCRGDARSV